jgi:hypothetical protein
MMAAVFAPACLTEMEGVDFHALLVGNYQSRFAIKKASGLASWPRYSPAGEGGDQGSRVPGLAWVSPVNGRKKARRVGRAGSAVLSGTKAVAVTESQSFPLFAKGGVKRSPGWN